MNNTDLTGRKFEDKYGNSFIILAGRNGEAIAYEETGKNNAFLNFCYEATLCDKGLRGSYFVSYAVSREKFFNAIENTEINNLSIESIVSSLRKKYYKIPKVFLALVAEMYINEKEQYNE